VPDERVIQQVGGILGMNDIAFKTDANKETFLVAKGSAGVFISFAEMGDSNIIVLRAVVLEQVDGSGERRQKILEALNEKNRRIPFGCFSFDPDNGFVVLDHALLGDQLQGQELLHALFAIASTADDLDDELREAIGSGVRATDAWNAAEAQASESGGVGPVVET
jgi:hypothetical protein